DGFVVACWHLDLLAADASDNHDRLSGGFALGFPGLTNLDWKTEQADWGRRFGAVVAMPEETLGSHGQVLGCHDLPLLKAFETGELLPVDSLDLGNLR